MLMWARRAALAVALTASFLSGCGGDYLTNEDLALVERNFPDYERAALFTGIPWQALAAIHYRESNLSRDCRNIGGPFMLDRGGDRVEFDARVRKEELRVARAYSYINLHARVRGDFRFACLVAADELKVKSRGWLRKIIGINGWVLADAMWGYNGRAKSCRSWRDSAYVSNDPASGRVKTMRWQHNAETVMYVDDVRPGAYIIYLELCRRMKGGIALDRRVK